jgi:hypothetical protein
LINANNGAATIIGSFPMKKTVKTTKKMAGIPNNGTPMPTKANTTMKGKGKGKPGC